MGTACDKINPLLLAQRCSFTTKRDKPKGYRSDTCQRYRELNLRLTTTATSSSCRSAVAAAAAAAVVAASAAGCPASAGRASASSTASHGAPTRGSHDQRPDRDAGVGADVAMITRRTKIQLIVFALITLLGVSFVGAHYAKLDRFFLDKNYTVAAHFAESGGIFTGAEVSYRGVTVGKVGRHDADRQGRRRGAQHREGLRGHPEGHQGGRRQPVGGRRAVRRPAAADQGQALPRGRLGDPART